MLSPSTKYQKPSTGFANCQFCQLPNCDIFKELLWRPHTLGRCRSIAIFSERINYENKDNNAGPCQLPFLALPSGPVSW